MHSLNSTKHLATAAPLIEQQQQHAQISVFKFNYAAVDYCPNMPLGGWLIHAPPETNVQASGDRDGDPVHHSSILIS